MSETLPKCGGFEQVRLYVVARCAESPGGVARITNKEAGDAVGITGQAAGKHLQFLVLSGVLTMLRRSVYSLVSAPSGDPEVSLEFQNSFKTVSIETRMKPDPPPETAREVSKTFQNSFKSVSKPPKDNEEQETRNQKQEIKNLKFENQNFYLFELALGDGIRKSGFPSSTIEIDRGDFVDWCHPKARRVIQKVLRDIPESKAPDWSPNLTRRIAFGMIYVLPGFLDEDILRIRSIYHGQQQLVRDFLATAPGYRPQKKPKDYPAWVTIGGHAKSFIRGAGITWTDCEPPKREQVEAAAEEVRQAVIQGTFKETEAEPEYERTPEERDAIYRAQLEARKKKLARHLWPEGWLEAEPPPVENPLVRMSGLEGAEFEKFVSGIDFER